MTVIDLDESAPFAGILASLSASDPPAFEVAASSGSDPEMVVSQDPLATPWESDARKRDPFIQFTFLNSRVSISAYSLQSADRADEKKPHTWFLVASNDEDDWVTLDEQEQNWALRGRARTASIACNNATEDAFKFVRLQMPEPNFFGDWQFVLARVEFFGKIVPE
jgi:hypothetical protein